MSFDNCKQKHYTRQYERGTVIFVSCMSRLTVQCVICNHLFHLINWLCMLYASHIILVTIPSAYACAYHDYLLPPFCHLIVFPLLSHPLYRGCIFLWYCGPVNLFIFLHTSRDLLYIHGATPQFW